MTDVFYSENKHIGHNSPPGYIEHGAEIINELSAWLNDHPVIQNAEEAKVGKLLVDRARLCAKDMDDERKSKVSPLNQQVKLINDNYKRVSEPMAKILGELVERMDAYVKTEEAKRLETARIAREAAEKAERFAREAEERERAAREEANHGVLDAGIGDAVVSANKAFDEYQRTLREAARAENATNVKVGGGFSRALSQRNKETLEVVSALDAVKAMGVTVWIHEAILTSARKYREMTGELPDGVISKIERSL